MSEPTYAPAPTTPPPSDDDWLTAAAAEPLDNATTQPRIAPRTMAVRAGLVAAGAVVGAVAVVSVSHGRSTSAAPTAAIGAPGNAGGFPGGAGQQFPGGAGQQLPGGGPFGGGPGGGLAGEQHLAGTLVAVGSSTVTVKTSAGTATYAVTSSSEIVRNGQVVALSALRPGDAVFVHVYSSGASSRLVVERIFAGSSATGART